MPITPDDIAKAKFVTSLRGYNREDVEAFLQGIADDYQRLLDDVETGHAVDPPPGPTSPEGAEADTAFWLFDEEPPAPSEPAPEPEASATEPEPATEVEDPVIAADRDTPEPESAPAETNQTEPQAPPAETDDQTTEPQAPPAETDDETTEPQAPPAETDDQTTEPQAPLAEAEDDVPTVSTSPTVPPPPDEADGVAALLLEAEERAWELREAVERELALNLGEVGRIRKEAAEQAKEVRAQVMQRVHAALRQPGARLSEIAAVVNDELLEADRAASRTVEEAERATRAARRLLYDRLVQTEFEARGLLVAAHEEACRLLSH